MDMNYILIIELLLLAGVEIESSVAQECSDGDVRAFESLSDPNRLYPQYCAGGQWRLNCGGNDFVTWGFSESEVACRDLGYGYQNNGPGRSCNDLPVEGQTSSFFRIDSNCDENEPTLSQCTIEQLGSCSCATGSQYGWIRCQLERGCANEGEVRLWGGESPREGRVEVCSGGRWVSVCNDNQQLPAAVCQSLGHPASGAVLRTFTEDGVVFPLYSCSTLGSCSRSNCQSWLGLECLTQETHDNIGCLSADLASPPATVPQDCPTEPTCTCTTTQNEDISTTAMNCSNGAIDLLANTGPCSNVTGALGGLLAVLVVVIIGLIIGWALTYCAMRKQHQQKQIQPIIDDDMELSRNLDNPVYDASTTATGTYDVIDTNNYSSVQDNGATGSSTDPGFSEVDPAMAYEVPYKSQGRYSNEEYSTIGP